MKTHEKKKRYQVTCRERVKEGLVNLASGEWRKPVTDLERAAYDAMAHGYKLK